MQPAERTAKRFVTGKCVQCFVTGPVSDSRRCFCKRLSASESQPVYYEVVQYCTGRGVEYCTGQYSIQWSRWHQFVLTFGFEFRRQASNPKWCLPLDGQVLSCRVVVILLSTYSNKDGIVLGGQHNVRLHTNHVTGWTQSCDSQGSQSAHEACWLVVMTARTVHTTVYSRIYRLAWDSQYHVILCSTVGFFRIFRISNGIVWYTEHML